MNWHSTDINTLVRLYGTSLQGLPEEQAEQRLLKEGPNQLEEKNQSSAWVLFISQFKDFMILVLILAAAVSGLIGEMVDAIIILIIVLANAIIGFIQEYRAGKAMQALKKMATPGATVLRDNKPRFISSIKVVPGDIVLLEAGNTVPADLRIVEAAGLRIAESSLTGESLPVEKSPALVLKTDLPLGDRKTMAYKSTQVVKGRGKGVVVATGMKTEIGRIASMLQEKESTTPLQKRMTDFGKKLSYGVLLICGLLFIVGLLRGEPPLRMLLVAISLAVAAIPEALPALITIALAMGAKRLVRKNVLVRKLAAVETLGSVTVICSDKTGTLTQNMMKVVNTFPFKAEPLLEPYSNLELGMILNSDVQLKENGELTGDPTETAIIEAINKRHTTHAFINVRLQFPRVAEIPFDSERKSMTTVHRWNEQYLVVVKGALEAIQQTLETDWEMEKMVGESEGMGKRGIRVLAYAYKLMDQMPTDLQRLDTELSFAGLIGMRDPPRPDIMDAIAACRRAGIRPVMITGDHPATASAIAREIGILMEKENVITGKELATLDPEELYHKVEKIAVYARVSPEQKLKIVEALQRHSHFVAMTGDGVNDAPALKKANIGIAMGITGTDVSKESAHMILMDDNFASIVKAVEEGRRIYGNIRKFIKYIMTCNGAEIWTLFLAPLVGLPIPLLPVHILWINLITDGLPGLALSAEKAERDIMNKPPRRPDETMFSEGTGMHILWVGLFMAFLTLGTQAWAIHAGDSHWQTMVFTVLSLSQLAHVLAIRSDREYIFKRGFFSNPFLLGAIAVTFLLQLAVIYLPFANRVFKTQALTLSELALCVAVSALLFHAVEAEKWVRKRTRARYS